MSSSRSFPASVARLLASAEEPIYVLDDRRRILYVNPACAAWLSVPAEELIGLTCSYHTPSVERDAASSDAASSAPDSAAPNPAAVSAAAALCPPPRTFLGASCEGEITPPVAEGQASPRRVYFQTLGNSPESFHGVVAFVHPADSPLPDADSPVKAENPSAPKEDAEARLLHRRVHDFHRRFRLRYRVESLIGDHPAMRRAREQILLAAQSDVPVFLLGPKGSGRNHAARAIHYHRGPVPSARLIPLSCELLETELLCSTIEALVSSSSGRVEQPGSLLLNDVDRLSDAGQRELHRLFSAPRFAWRLLSSAEQSPIRLAAQGAFHRDLACRLETLSIEFPSLQERAEDIPLLVQAFVEQLNAQGGRQWSGFSSEALDKLAVYPWPGNLSELELFVRQACDAASGPLVGVKDLPREISWGVEAAVRRKPPEESIVLDQFLTTIEKELISRALRRAKGNKSKAAKLLGLTRPRLYRRLIQLGMIRE